MTSINFILKQMNHSNTENTYSAIPETFSNISGMIGNTTTDDFTNLDRQPNTPERTKVQSPDFMKSIPARHTQSRCSQDIRIGPDRNFRSFNVQIAETRLEEEQHLTADF